jgi:hypothetical protein
VTLSLLDNDLDLHIDKITVAKMQIIKDSMNSTKEWAEWLDELFDMLLQEDKQNSTQILENIFEKNLYEKYYDDWIRNFASNLENIWNGNSARDLTPTNNQTKAAIVIGRGPSIFKHKHLDLLANSNYDGTIVCTDGALVHALNAGVTPDKFKEFFVVTIDTQTHISKLYDDPIIKQYGNKIKCILSSTVPQSTYTIAIESGMQVFWTHALFDYNKGKSSFNYISGAMTKTKNHQKGLPAIQTGGNVGTSSWIISWSILKCSPTVLIGIDHGYPAEMSWEEIGKYHKIPGDVSKDSDAFKKAYPTIYNPVFDCYVKQDPIFQYYSNALKEFIPKAPSWVQTINATGGGAIFGDGINCMKFEDFLAKNNFTKS